MSHIDTEKGLIAWFARNSVAANLLMWILIFGGILASYTIHKQVFPNFTFNNIVVRVPYLGAAPQEVEEGVVRKIEEAIKDIEGIKKITSTAVEGMATVNVEIEEEYDVQLALDEIKVQVDAIPSFPANTEKPIVYRQKATQDVLWVSIYGDASERELKEFAKQMRDEIANLPGLSAVQVIGARDYEVSIEISEAKLQEYSLTFSELVNAVRRSSIDLPGGSIRSENGDILLRAKGQAYNAYDFYHLVLLTRTDGTRLVLGDIATIRDGFVEDNNYALFDGKPAVNLQIQAVGDQNALKISEAVNAYLDNTRADLPGNIKADTWGDSSFYLADRLSMMLTNMFFGALLVFLVLSLFLKLRLAAWVMVGLPVCFLGALLVMQAEVFNISINMISLFGFILVLGIVVDDAIIMGESAYSEISQKGHNAENVIRGVKRVAMPATFGVLTTIAAFTPMLMVPGTFGVIWKTIGWVVIICLIFSLIESKLILPAHLVHMKDKPYDPSKANALQRFRDFFSEGIKRFIDRKYAPFLAKVIRNRYTTLACFFGILIITIGLFMGGIVRFVFFPNIPSDFIMGTVETEAGSSIVHRDKAIDSLLIALEEMDESFKNEYGQPVVKHSIAFNQGNLGGQVFVELSKGETREFDAFAIQQRWRDYMPEIAGLRKIDIGSPGGPGGGADLTFEFSGKNLDELKQATDKLKLHLQSFDGVADVNDTFSGGSDEIRLSIKPQAEALGLSLDTLATQVRYGFYGAEAQRIQRGDEEVKVMVRYPKEQRSSVGHLENMRIRTADNQEIPFSEVADIELAQGYGSIVRVDGNRSITVTAKADKSKIDPQEVASNVEKNFIPGLLQQHPSVEFRLEGASKEQGDALFSLLQGFLFALFAIYALMAIPLKSYSQPFIIMSVIPFGIVGAIFGHLLLGHAVSVLSICGIIALTGVVVNDSLILVDFVNRARAEGHPLIDAVIQSGRERFRAIVLTSLTTFMGLMPIVFEKSLQAQIVIPMAISLAFGILFATVITLLLVPSLYLILDDFKSLFRSKKSTGKFDSNYAFDDGSSD
ncbi:efflux RND transporter permease subunit [Aliiglaciecola sp. LCG003]|uniref:efflux RND transporter permease subunit n=1 Tax=Aliiglaciecola sp. LCG003 TaxID=3053655 RepID=UPI0025725C2F|nr:efflux RND transporter permease subunit [Aliiglaciecola sp. LCG003]WJG11062.1 efflux RND transporter permease subunit [Aliiglaciecola sp. LCG003]